MAEGFVSTAHIGLSEHVVLLNPLGNHHFHHQVTINSGFCMLQPLIFEQTPMA
jgi:hypothetical protein